MTPIITMPAAPKPHMRQAILEPLLAFNQQRSGVAYTSNPLAVLLTYPDAAAPDTAASIGGLWGSTGFGHLHIDVLFVPETLRGRGIGGEIIRSAENEAVRRGCHGAWLDTFSFQARGFYERLGYTVFGSIDDYPTGHSRFFLKKALASTGEPA